LAARRHPGLRCVFSHEIQLFRGDLPWKCRPLLEQRSRFLSCQRERLNGRPRAELAERQPIEEDYTFIRYFGSILVYFPRQWRRRRGRQGPCCCWVGKAAVREGGSSSCRAGTPGSFEGLIYFVVGHRLARPTKCAAPSHHASSTHGSEHEKLRVARVNLRAETAAQLNASRKILALQHIAHTEASHRAFR
jgi:hypothetical protein